MLDAAVPQPWVGRQLFGLFKRAGLRDVRVVPHAICFPGAAGFAVYQQLNRGTIDRAAQSGQVPADEVVAWWAALTPASEAETFFSVVLGFIAAGRKPEQWSEQGNLGVTGGAIPYRRQVVPLGEDVLPN